MYKDPRVRQKKKKKSKHCQGDYIPVGREITSTGVERAV